MASKLTECGPLSSWLPPTALGSEPYSLFSSKSCSRPGAPWCPPEVRLWTSIAVGQQGSSWPALFRTGPFTQPRLGKDPCNSHPSRNSQGHDCQGCPASQMALLCCDLFLCIHYPVLHRLGSFISEETIFFRPKLCQFFNNISPLKGHSSYSLRF